MFYMEYARLQYLYMVYIYVRLHNVSYGIAVPGMVTMLVSIIGGSFHKYHFCRDKHVFVSTKHIFCRDKNDAPMVSVNDNRSAD